MEMKAIFALLNLSNGTKLLPLPIPGGRPGPLIMSHYIQPGTGCQCACDRHVIGMFVGNIPRQHLLPEILDSCECQRLSPLQLLCCPLSALESCLFGGLVCFIFLDHVCFLTFFE